MNSQCYTAATLLVALCCAASVSWAAEPLPDAIRAPGETAVMTLYAEGAQIYECKMGRDGKLVWTFREPVATLLLDGKTVGRHYAGPHWELADGSIIKGNVTGRAPGAASADIPLLKLEMVDRKGSGQLTGITTIQRVRTKGGALEGPCSMAGSFQSVAYATDYIFLKK